MGHNYIIKLCPCYFILWFSPVIIGSFIRHSQLKFALWQTTAWKVNINLGCYQLMHVGIHGMYLHSVSNLKVAVQSHLRCFQRMFASFVVNMLRAYLFFYKDDWGGKVREECKHSSPTHKCNLCLTYTHCSFPTQIWMFLLNPRVI